MKIFLKLKHLLISQIIMNNIFSKIILIINI
nr:MAG TPA: hypothetical protein [Caudoviricetes sp.]